jgi:Domain of unknown function (DUF4265)
MIDPTYKVAFELEQDEDGYPPVKVETLWASRVGPDLYCLDNIPFYARGVSSEDIVRTRSESGMNIFQEVLRPSQNSVFRIYVSEETDVPNARASFKHLGCESELSDLPKLFAVEVPGDVAFGPVSALLTEGLDKGRWEYEEACLRHVTA